MEVNEDGKEWAPGGGIACWLTALPLYKSPTADRVIIFTPHLSHLSS